MKKLLIALFCLLNLFAASAAENIIFESTYPIDNISKFEIGLSYENLYIESYFGSEISIQVDSNNIKMLPEIILTNEKLLLKSKNTKFKKADYCKIKIFLPKEYSSKIISASTTKGLIQASDISALSLLKFSSVSGSIFAKNVSAPDLEIFTFSGMIQTDILNTDFFSITSDSGAVEVSLLSSPSAFSEIINSTGPVSLFLPDDACIQLSANTNTGKISDDINKTLLFSKNKYLMPFGKDGPSLNIKTNSGNIRINPL